MSFVVKEQYGNYLNNIHYNRLYKGKLGLGRRQVLTKRDGYDYLC
jgi:hypothetical protein